MILVAARMEATTFLVFGHLDGCVTIPRNVPESGRKRLCKCNSIVAFLVPRCSFCSEQLYNDKLAPWESEKKEEEKVTVDRKAQTRH